MYLLRLGADPGVSYRNKRSYTPFDFAQPHIRRAMAEVRRLDTAGR